MALSELTSRDAVLAAINEFDALGRDAFLEKYGFGSARQYFIQHDHRRYDSKAVAGVAYGKQFPERGPLSSNQFDGGEKAAGGRWIARIVGSKRTVHPASRTRWQRSTSSKYRK